jgi:hypothetical protein
VKSARENREPSVYDGRKAHHKQTEPPGPWRARYPDLTTWVAPNVRPKLTGRVWTSAAWIGLETQSPTPLGHHARTHFEGTLVFETHASTHRRGQNTQTPKDRDWNEHWAQSPIRPESPAALMEHKRNTSVHLPSRGRWGHSLKGGVYWYLYPLQNSLGRVEYLEVFMQRSYHQFYSNTRLSERRACPFFTHIFNYLCYPFPHVGKGVIFSIFLISARLDGAEF